MISASCNHGTVASTCRRASVLLCSLLCALSAHCLAEEKTAVARFQERGQPILETYCYGCHANGERKGGHAFDEFKSDSALVGDRKLWLEVLKNVRAGLMPPAGEERPHDVERRKL